MPQTANQRNQQSNARMPLPQPLPDPSGVETEDQVYGLVSVLYHALQGAQACEQYLDDAERSGDDELMKFFEECRDQQKERATRAKQLLLQRADEEDDDEEEET